MTMPTRPPGDIHLVCTEHPGVSDLNSWTSIWAHVRSDHPTASPCFNVAASGYPPEPTGEPVQAPDEGPGQGQGRAPGQGTTP